MIRSQPAVGAQAAGVPDFETLYAAHFQSLTLQLFAYTNDLDLAEDVVQEAFCRALSRWSRLSAYDELERGAGGTFATRTTVVNVDPASGAEITDVRAGPNATIEVELRLAEAGGKAGRQVRTFGWNGSRFVQVAGPVSIPTAAPATDLAVTASDVLFSAPADNRRSATLTVTVANHGPLPVDRIRMTFLMRNLAVHASPTPENEEWRSHCTFDGYSLGDDKVTCEYPGMAAGASATYHLIFNTVGEIGGMGGIFDHHQLTVDAVDARVKTDSNPLDNAAGYQINAA